jgi:N6-adenosine-specific RNA methylase IME4
MADPILWQNDTASVTLLDIPGTITGAQGTATYSSQGTLISVEPLKEPFPSNEPKSAKARAKLATNTVDQVLHGEYENLLEQALSQIRSDHDGPWCLPRTATLEAPRAAKKRKIASTDEDSATDLAGIVHPRTLSICAPASGSRVALIKQPQPADIDTPPIYEFNPVEDNDQPSPMRKQSPGDSKFFHMPANSRAILGDCSDSNTFHQIVHEQAQNQRDGGREDFDFILLDPPWPNRSVKRTHQTEGSTYSTVATLADLKELLLSMRLDAVMTEECMVGIWTTNRPAIRDFVVGKDGLFEHWQLELAEEWIWLKTTVHGEPVTQLDALWRKPYEVLLLGRRRMDARGEGVDDEGAGDGRDDRKTSLLKRRVIVGVPDLHSRKPCLKRLIEPLLASTNATSNCSVLEVFARHLVEGWWSWGNECIKSNLEERWAQDGQEPQVRIEN